MKHGDGGGSDRMLTARDWPVHARHTALQYAVHLLVQLLLSTKEHLRAGHTADVHGIPVTCTKLNERSQSLHSLVVRHPTLRSCFFRCQEENHHNHLPLIVPQGVRQDIEDDERVRSSRTRSLLLAIIQRRRRESVV